MARELDRLSEPALMRCARLGVHRVDDLRLARGKAGDKVYVLIVDYVDVLGAEEALLVGVTHKSGWIKAF